MLDIKDIDGEARKTMARELAKHINYSGGVAEISREAFDFWIIDNGLADDPGTTDTRSAPHKGFVQMRNNARKTINQWASKLPFGEAFSIVLDKDNKDGYLLTQVEEASYAEAADIGNRVEKFTKNKVRRVGRLRTLAIDLADTSEGADSIESLLKMIGMVEGYGLVMQKNIRAEVGKFNQAIERVEAEATKLKLDAPEVD